MLRALSVRCVVLAFAICASAPASAAAASGLLSELPATPTTAASTVPQNGDVNPYGIAFVPEGFPDGGLLQGGDIVVSNFNASSNLQGTGTTVVVPRVDASPSLLFQDAATPGLTTALGVLKGGFVLVGQLPSTDGSGACTPGPDGREGDVGQGALLVIDRFGRLVRSLTSERLLDGPWDLAIARDDGAQATLFVSNALSGTVTRLELLVDSVGDDVTVLGATTIASGYVHRCDAAAFVVGPTGLALDPERDVLYVASTGDNAIFAVPNASSALLDHGTGRAAVSDAAHLHGPLGLVRTTSGDLISAQGDAVNSDPTQPSEIVEFTPRGGFVAEFSIDPASGSAFGLALESTLNGFRFTAVDDGLNVLDVWAVR